MLLSGLCIHFTFTSNISNTQFPLSIEFYINRHPLMSERKSKRVKSQFGGTYRDRIPLDDDFDIVKARTEAVSGPTYLPAQAGRSVWSSSWTIGESWAPEESFEFSLDPDHAQYDAVVDADLADVMEELVAPKKKGKRSQASVCRPCFCILNFIPIFCRPDQMFSGSTMLVSCISKKC